MPLTELQRAFIESTRGDYLDIVQSDKSRLMELVSELSLLSVILNEGGSNTSSTSDVTILPSHETITNNGSTPATGIVPSGKWFVYFDVLVGQTTVNGQTYEEGWTDSETFKFLQKGIVYDAISYSVPVGSSLRFTYYPT